MEVKTWQDTVMGEEQILTLKIPCEPGLSTDGLLLCAYKGIAKAQAEISFKAGKSEGHREALDDAWDKVMGAKKSGFDEGRQEGIREVVEWIKSLKHRDRTSSAGKYYFFPEIEWGKWQAKLKKWGIS